jgi:hypothetical protein
MLRRSQLYDYSTTAANDCRYPVVLVLYVPKSGATFVDQPLGIIIQSERIASSREFSSINGFFRGCSLFFWNATRPTQADRRIRRLQDFDRCRHR